MLPPSDRALHILCRELLRVDLGKKYKRRMVLFFVLDKTKTAYLDQQLAREQLIQNDRDQIIILRN